MPRWWLGGAQGCVCYRALHEAAAAPSDLRMCVCLALVVNLAYKATARSSRQGLPRNASQTYAVEGLGVASPPQKSSLSASASGEAAGRGGKRGILEGLQPRVPSG